MASTAMAITLILLKSWAAIQTGSMAMLGSLADSGLDLVVSLIVLLAVRVAAQPADHEHRFGHGKAEALAALVQVILITLSALFIAVRSVQRLIGGAQTGQAELGIGVSVVAMVLTIALISYQRHVVRRTKSLAIGTDRLHYSSDLLLNGSICRAPGGRRNIRGTHRALADVGRLDRLEPCPRPADGQGMAR
jgi:ferrous-iron efflux pump FieF